MNQQITQSKSYQTGTVFIQQKLSATRKNLGFPDDHHVPVASASFEKKSTSASIAKPATRSMIPSTAYQ